MDSNQGEDAKESVWQWNVVGEVNGRSQCGARIIGPGLSEGWAGRVGGGDLSKMLEMEMLDSVHLLVMTMSRALYESRWKIDYWNQGRLCGDLITHASMYWGKFRDWGKPFGDREKEQGEEPSSYWRYENQNRNCLKGLLFSGCLKAPAGAERWLMESKPPA